MRKLLKYLLIAILTLIAFIIIAACLYWGAAIYFSGHALHEMDWNTDGSVTISEVLDAPEYGRRPIRTGQKDCVEFFTYKQGVPIRLDCPNEEPKKIDLRK